MKKKGKKSKIKRWSLLLTLFMLALAFCFWRIFKKSAPPHYLTITIHLGELKQDILTIGRLDALHKVEVGAQVSGQLKTLLVKIGDKVRRGQLLGIIDQKQAKNHIKEFEAILLELHAQRYQLEAELKLAKLTLNRQQVLAKTGLISQQELDSSRTKLAVKQAQISAINAQIKRNQASLDTARINFNYTRIISPMTGEVTQINTLQGQTVISAQQAPNILTLADMSIMLVNAQVPEADIIHLRPNQKAWFTILGDRQVHYESVLKDILPTPIKVNDAIFYYARLEVPNPKGIFRIGMTAQVHIQLNDKKNVLTIPLIALGTYIRDNCYKIKVLHNDKIDDREIVIGLRNDTDAVVLKGLKEGEKVIISENKN